jgi:hypothetical protein
MISRSYVLYVKVDAENFVTNLLTEEEAVGRVSAVPGLARAQRQQLQLQSREEEDEEEEGAQQQGRSFSRIARGYDLVEGEEEEDVDVEVGGYPSGGAGPARRPQQQSGLGKRRGGYIRESVSEDEDEF